jgi:SAM-dependent methyltransferase
MFNETLPFLRCPSAPSAPSTKRSSRRGHCGSELTLHADRKQGTGEVFDVLSGHLDCPKCESRFPILAGVAVLVEDVRGFLLAHVKGIAQAVPESEFPREYARELKAAKKELAQGHIEDDLEAERVISLYLMNHFLHAAGLEGKSAWWRSREGSASPLIDRLVREHWDQGPLDRIAKRIRAEADKIGRPLKTVELGCGVGGLALKAAPQAAPYLGVDSSFAAIALARHLVLGAPYRGKVRIPEDLLQGPVSREISVVAPTGAKDRPSQVDYVVGELEAAPVAKAEWDLSVALNTIDMLEEPGRLPELQRELLKARGLAIQSCPYIWHEAVASKLRKRLAQSSPPIRSSAGAAEWLYEQAGFEIESREDHVPWLFFKHVRQLEIYSVHLFLARARD